MLVYTTPHTVRVEITEGIYCLAVSGPDNMKSFFLIHDRYGDPVFMFACATGSDTETAQLAYTNAESYIPAAWLEE